MSIGRPKIYTDPLELEKDAQDYFKWAKDNPIIQQVSHVKNGVQDVKITRPLTLEGLSVFLGFTRATFWNYKNKEAFFDICTRIEEQINQQNLEMGMAGVYNASLVAMKLGLKEKNDEKRAINITMVTKSGDEFEKLVDENN